MLLIRTGTYCTIDDLGGKRDEVFNYLDPAFSYPIEGAEFSDKYQSGFWDGRSHLLRRSKGERLVFPPGLWGAVVARLEAGGFAFAVKDARKSRRIDAFRAWKGPAPAVHQESAVMAALDEGGGIVKIAIRGGKTLVAARVAHELKQRTLFVVPSNLLVSQTAAAFSSYLEGPRITRLGGGYNDDSGDVVVASIQSLAVRWSDPSKGRRWFMKIRDQFGLVVIDELHHGSSTGRKWREVLHRLDAYYRLGLSATIELDRDGGLDESDIELRGICGPIVVNVLPTELIETGWLVRPTITFHDHGAPPLKGHSKSPWTTVYKHGIAECAERNQAIARSAAEHARAGRRVLIDYWQRGHGRWLAHLVRERGVNVGLMHGETKDDQRERLLRGLVDGSMPVLVSNVMGEGVDVPALEVVSNAEGGRAFVSTIQRLRNLTRYPGKTEAFVDEWIDDHHKTLEEHMKARWAVYRREPGFIVEIE